MTTLMSYRCKLKQTTSGRARHAAIFGVRWLVDWPTWLALVPSSTARRRSGRNRPCIEQLESRTLLCADHFEKGAALLDDIEIGTFPVVLDERPEASSATSSSVQTATYSLSSIPALNSLPGAAASLYLDFDGNFEKTWGSYRNITTPAFDKDRDPTTFNDDELLTIRQIWDIVAEDYAPFQINVTTVEPTSFANGIALRVAIGGSSFDWFGTGAGGVSYVGSFTNSIVNTAYVFPRELGSSFRLVAEASSHEAGHAFGLQHQSLYDAAGAKVDEYYRGPGDGRAPIMGTSYYATRGVWWYGTSSLGPTTYQDDMSVIASATNGFGYRPDDYGNTIASATPLASSTGLLIRSGIIESTADVDSFSFDAGDGLVNVSLILPPPRLGSQPIGNLDARLELRDSLGNVLAVNDSDNFASVQTISTTVAAGNYVVIVGSHGLYGDVGQYTVVASTLQAPTNLAAVGISTSQVKLTWNDNANKESGYIVERSTDTSTWTTLTPDPLPAETTEFSDATVTAGPWYFYRVRAIGVGDASPYSSTVRSSGLPDAPAVLTATTYSSNRIDLAWTSVPDASGYTIQRSADGGATWASIAFFSSADVTSFQNTGLAPATTYMYRAFSNNAGGASAFSNLATATTFAVPAIPEAPTALTAIAASTTRVNLAWTDNSAGESGFSIERTSNGKTWTKLAQVGANVQSYADTTASARKTYSYRVQALNNVGGSAYSNVATVTTPAAGPLPGAGAVLSESPHSVDLALLFWLSENHASTTRKK